MGPSTVSGASTVIRKTDEPATITQSHVWLTNSRQPRRRSVKNPLGACAAVSTGSPRAGASPAETGGTADATGTAAGARGTGADQEGAGVDADRPAGPDRRDEQAAYRGAERDRRHWTRAPAARSPAAAGRGSRPAARGRCMPGERTRRRAPSRSAGAAACGTVGTSASRSPAVTNVSTARTRSTDNMSLRRSTRSAHTPPTVSASTIGTM